MLCSTCAERVREAAKPAAKGRDLSLPVGVGFLAPWIHHPLARRDAGCAGRVEWFYFLKSLDYLVPSQASAAMWFWAILYSAAAVAGVAAGILAWRTWRTLSAATRLRRARQEFHLRREWLEADFLKMAGQNGSPKGLNWTHVEFDDSVSFARDRQTGQPRALVGVVIHFAAVAGGGMEENPNVGLPRAATALFLYEQGKWITQGRAIFNMNPAQAILHFHRELESVKETG